MSAIVTRQCHRLAESLGELKAKVRAALANELAGAVGTAVRDVLVVALIDRLCTPPRTVSPRPPSSRPMSWRDDEDGRERDEWGYVKDPWDEPDEDRDRAPLRSARADPDDVERRPVVPAAAVAVGVTVGRWWLARNGTVAAAVTLGVLATGLGLAGGPVARAALAVLAAAGDVLAAEAALGRAELS